MLVSHPNTLRQLGIFLQQRQRAFATIYPPQNQWFAALNCVAPNQVKVVIVGQDPYHQPNQANGFCFSVQAEQSIPPSLRNIFTELNQDVGVIKTGGDLQGWANQGVLLLNAVLTVEQGQATAHANQGWEYITDAIIDHLNKREHIVFILWGNYAQRKGSCISRQKHCVLNAPHPSPLSAHRGFFGSKPFSQCNNYLKLQGQEPIDWGK